VFRNYEKSIRLNRKYHPWLEEQEPQQSELEQEQPPVREPQRLRLAVMAVMDQISLVVSQLLLVGERTIWAVTTRRVKIVIGIRRKGDTAWSGIVDCRTRNTLLFINPST
jgi:hypothetical protein